MDNKPEEKQTFRLGDIPQPPLVKSNKSDYLGDDKPWLPSGRFSRLAFIAWSSWVIIGFLALAGAILWLTMSGIKTRPSFDMRLLGYSIIGYIAVMVLWVIFSIRRLHDLNQSGWLSLLYLVPFVNALFSIYLMLIPGTPDANKYGVPRPTLTWEKIAGWAGLIILIILSIISQGLSSLLQQASQ